MREILQRTASTNVLVRLRKLTPRYVSVNGYQIGQVRGCKKPIKHGTWPTLPNFANLFRCSRTRSTACSIRRSNQRMEVGQLCQLGQIHKTAQKPTKQGTWPTLPNLANFFRCSQASSKTCSRLRSNQRIEVGQLCQLRQIQKPVQKPIKQGTWPTLSNLANFFRCSHASSTTCSTSRLNQKIEVGQLCQLGQIQKPVQKPTKQGTWPTLPSWSTFCADRDDLFVRQLGEAWKGSSV